MGRMMRKQEGVPIVQLLIYLLCSYALTLVILVLLAFLLFKLKLSEAVISGAIIITYTVSSFVGGFMAGKKMKRKKYIWGLLMGLAYYIVFVLLSLIINKGDVEVSRTILTTMILCCGGGMLGGMLS